MKYFIKRFLLVKDATARQGHQLNWRLISTFRKNDKDDLRLLMWMSAATWLATTQNTLGYKHRLSTIYYKWVISDKLLCHGCCSLLVLVIVMEMPGVDSGVETECDMESNDSSMSNISVGVAAPPDVAPSLHSPPLPPLPPPPLESSLPSLPPPPPAGEDGYLGDCSSDGGNEKNFPLPPDWKQKPHSCPSLPPSPLQLDTPHSPPQDDVVDPPAGLQFCSLAPSPDGGGGQGYHLLHQDWAHTTRHLKNKMRSHRPTSGLRSKYNSQVQVITTLQSTVLSFDKIKSLLWGDLTTLVPV